MKNKLLEVSGEESNMDVTSESGSNTDVVTDTDDDNTDGVSSAKRRKVKPSERDLQVPLERGWKRETVIKGLGKSGVIKGDVSYYSPCGKTFRSSPDWPSSRATESARVDDRQLLVLVSAAGRRVPSTDYGPRRGGIRQVGGSGSGEKIGGVESRGWFQGFEDE